MFRASNVHECLQPISQENLPSFVERQAVECLGESQFPMLSIKSSIILSFSEETLQISIAVAILFFVGQGRTKTRRSARNVENMGKKRKAEETGDGSDEGLCNTFGRTVTVSEAVVDKKTKYDPDESQDLSINEAGIDKNALYAEKARFVTTIAKPLASRKLAKKIYKCIKKAHKVKQLRKGIKEVQKCIRKKEIGLVILAGDTSPLDVICHMPVVCEESNLPYCYTPSKEDLGLAGGSKRPTCMVMIKTHKDYQELYDTLAKDLNSLPMPI